MVEPTLTQPNQGDLIDPVWGQDVVTKIQDPTDGHFHDGTGSKNIIQYEIVPYNDKIADITHADVNLHTLDLAAALTETRTIVAVQVYALRVAGTGWFNVWPNEGANGYNAGNDSSALAVIWIAAGTNRLQYNLGVANDDYDLYCFGYVVVAT